MTTPKLVPLAACVICHHNPVITPEYVVCGRCKQRLAAQIADLLELYALAGNELVPGRTGSSSASELTSGLRVSALAVRAGHDLIGVLAEHASNWLDLFGGQPLPPRYVLDPHGYKIHGQRVQVTLVELVAYLLKHLDRACRVPGDDCGVPDLVVFAQEVREQWAVLREAARVAPARSVTVTCPRDTDDPQVRCGNRLKVSPDLEAIVFCRQCHTSWTTRRLLLVVAADAQSDIWLDLEQGNPLVISFRS